MSNACLETKGLSAGYPGKVVVSGAEITVRPGEVVTLIGPNGAGKSTILKTIAGLIAPLAGTVYIEGKERGDYGLAELSRKMSVMMTERMSTDQMDCFDVASLGRFPYTGKLGLLTEADKEIVMKAMETVGLKDLIHRNFNATSDGQKQRVLLARAIAQEPEILIMDEPTSYLDIYYKLDFLGIVRRLVQERNIGVFMSMHELELAYTISDQVICVSSDGEIVRMGPPSEIFTDTFLSRLYGMESGKLTELYRSFADTIREGKDE